MHCMAEAGPARETRRRMERERESAAAVAAPRLAGTGAMGGAGVYEGWGGKGERWGGGTGRGGGSGGEGQGDVCGVRYRSVFAWGPKLRAPHACKSAVSTNEPVPEPGTRRVGAWVGHGRPSDGEFPFGVFLPFPPGKLPTFSREARGHER